MTDVQSSSLSRNKAPIWGLRPDLYYCQTVAGLFVWGALSDERTRLSFTFAAGPRQRSHFWGPSSVGLVTIFSLSNSRLPFPSPPTTRRATVEVFDPASTRDTEYFKVKVTLWLTVSQSVILSVEPHPGLMIRYLLLFDSYGLVLGGALSDERTGLSFIYAAGPRQRSPSRVNVPWRWHFAFYRNSEFSLWKKRANKPDQTGRTFQFG
jgi:hypothetical protein